MLRPLDPSVFMTEDEMLDDDPLEALSGVGVGGRPIELVSYEPEVEGPEWE